jgi:hypothetical protein
VAPIEDPYGGQVEGYKKAAEKIDRFLASGLPRIVSITENVQRSS